MASAIWNAAEFLSTSGGGVLAGLIAIAVERHFSRRRRSGSS